MACSLATHTSSTTAGPNRTALTKTTHIMEPDQDTSDDHTHEGVHPGANNQEQSGSTWPPIVSFADGPPVVLSLDFGGAGRTIVQLELLDAFMRKISRFLKVRDGGIDRILKPCEVFHLIVGNGTGGMMAILLGRLRMSVAEAYDFYLGLYMDILLPLMQPSEQEDGVNPAGQLATLRATAAKELESRITKLVRDRNMGTYLLEDENPPLGKVLVGALDDAPGMRFLGIVLARKLRSHQCAVDLDYNWEFYRRDWPDERKLSIVEAVMATMSHSEPFERKGTILDRDSPETFPDPINLAREEAKAIFEDQRMGSRERVFVSVGDTVNYVKTAEMVKTEEGGQEVEKLVTLNARVYNRVEGAHYFRLNTPYWPRDNSRAERIHMLDTIDCAISTINLLRISCIEYQYRREEEEATSGFAATSGV